MSSTSQTFVALLRGINVGRKKMTVRNVNTFRKPFERMRSINK